MRRLILRALSPATTPRAAHADHRVRARCDQSVFSSQTPQTETTSCPPRISIYDFNIFLNRAELNALVQTASHRVEEDQNCVVSACGQVPVTRNDLVGRAVT